MANPFDAVTNSLRRDGRSTEQLQSLKAINDSADGRSADERCRARRASVERRRWRRKHLAASIGGALASGLGLGWAESADFGARGFVRRAARVNAPAAPTALHATVAGPTATRVSAPQAAARRSRIREHARQRRRRQCGRRRRSHRPAADYGAGAGDGQPVVSGSQPRYRDGGAAGDARNRPC